MHSKLWWAELRHFVIQAFCWFDWFVSIDALHSTWQSIWCVAHVWTNLDRCAVIRLCRISWWAGTQYAPNLLWWLQMPWCETGTKLKRKCPYLDDKMNTLFPISRLPISGHCLDFALSIMLNDMYVLLQIIKWNWYRYAGVVDSLFSFYGD